MQLPFGRIPSVASRRRSSLASLAVPGTDRGRSGPPGPNLRSRRPAHRPLLRGTTRRRGIPGPSGPCHGHRSARRAARRTTVRGSRPRARSMPRISFASSSTCRRRASSSPRRSASRGRGGPRPAAVGHRRRLRRDRSTSWSSTPDHDADRVTEALVEELLRSASNKGCTVVETASPDDPMRAGRAASAPGSPRPDPRLQRTVTAAEPTARRRLIASRRAA